MRFITSAFLALSAMLIATCQAQAQSVVINEFRNQTPDAAELLVVQADLDMRGMILKDYSSSGVNDGGGGYTFSTDTLWSSLPAGTIIVLRRDASAADTTVGGSDYNLDVGLSNTTYFAAEAGSFDIATSDILQIKASGSGKAGTTGAIHTFASGTAGSAAQYTASPTPKLATSSGDTGTGKSAEAGNATQALSDFNGTDATGGGATGSIGTWNNANNQAYITALRGGEVGGETTNVQFTGSAATVSEAAGTAQITVYKTSTNGNVSAQIQLGGTAANPADYSISTTNIALNGATTSQTVTVSIVDDGDTESSETVTLTIANVTVGQLGAPSVYTLTITDNDGPSSGLLISQYTETESGTTPKGIEVWNSTGADITFDSSANKLDVKVGANGGAAVSQITVESGTLAAGDVLVIGTSDMTPDVVETFTYNGDDAVVLEFGGVVVDMIGIAGSDPGSAWSGGGVSTANQNIELLPGLTVGDADGWIDPSTRFTNVSVGSVLTGFGTPPGGVAPITTNVKFSAASASVGEASVSYTVTVVKTVADGSVTGEVALSGTATEGGPNDFTVSPTNFVLDGATTSATFVVTINNDEVTEVSETVILTLTNVTGAAIVAPSAFTLTITDDDIPLQEPEGIASFRFYSATAPYLSVTTNDPGITVSEMSMTVGSISTNVTTGTYFPNEPYVQASGGWTDGEQASAKAFQFTITPEAGFQVTVTALSFRAYSTPSGPTAMGYDIGGLATYSFNATNDSLMVVSQSVTGVDNQVSPILVKIQGWTNGTRASSSSGDFRLDDVLVFGVIAPAADSPPILAALGNKTVLTNTPLVFAVNATPTDGDTVTLSISNALPSGATFGSTNELGLFEWLAPGPVGVYTMTFYAADNDGADSEQITITVTSTPAPPAPLNLNVWINELHYDNTLTDTNQGIEVAGEAGTDLSGYSLVAYDGLSGTVYSNVSLSGVIPDESNGYGALWFDFLAAGDALQNAAEGVALVYNSTGLIQFLSYEGAFVGVGGVANGVTSTNIGVIEDSSTPVDWSLQLCGTGTNYASFTWSTNLPHSRGLLSACQVIPGVVDPNDEDGDHLPNAWENQYFGNNTGSDPYGDDDVDGFYNIEEFIAGTIPVGPSGLTNYFRGTSFAVSGASVSYASVTGRSYRLWSNTNLVAVPQLWSPAGGPQVGNGAVQTLSDTSGSTAPVYRITVEMVAP